MILLPLLYIFITQRIFLNFKYFLINYIIIINVNFRLTYMHFIDIIIIKILFHRFF